MPSKKPPRWIEYLPLAEIKAADRNPKLHDMDGIDRSMSQFGVIDIITIDDRTGQLVSGHGRTATIIAAHERGDEEPPDGVVVKGGVWQVPVVRGWSSKDDAEAEAAIVALNRLTELGGWDDRMLADMLVDLKGREDDLLDVTGYTANSLESPLLAALRPPDAPDDFGVIDPDGMELEHACPKCGFEF